MSELATIDQPETDVLDVHQAAEYLRMKRGWVYDAVRRGELPYVRLGRKLRFSKRALGEWFAAQVVRPTPSQAR